MLFTEPSFLFLFLPLVLGLYYLAPRLLRNAVLLLASLYFYSVGERLFVLVMIASILFNYGMGLWIDNTQPLRSRRILLVAGIVLNLGNLATFKYAGFITTNLNSLLQALHAPTFPSTDVHLPIGISFFTFHALSYLIDVYRRDVRAMRRLDSFALYITLFPQLIAGPIIRYKLIAEQFDGRRETVSGFSEGVRRFILGLGKKMIIANTVGQVADQVFAIPNALLTPGVAWLGIVCYTLQIYFDFSGYSDMAIGLGRMFGFVFPENFNYPYAARSITDFWRRWHMTLSNWFRDYLYIPLGGNQRGAVRTYCNLLVVFFLCGLWHGASWTFVIWGLFHGAFLIFERAGLGSLLRKLPQPLQQAYVVLVVSVGWVFFRADDFTQALGYLAAMVGLTAASGREYFVGLYLNSQLVLVFVVGFLASVPILPALSRLSERLQSRITALQGRWMSLFGATAELTCLAAVFFVSITLSAAGTYNPFIYFRF
jgi:alginate O-acetyltransferase complex protein AlgI